MQNIVTAVLIGAASGASTLLPGEVVVNSDTHVPVGLAVGACIFVSTMVGTLMARFQKLEDRINSLSCMRDECELAKKQKHRKEE